MTENEISIIAFDLGATSAFYASSVDVGEEFKLTSLLALYVKVNKLILLYNPDVILYPTPTRYYNCMRLHFQYIGVINLLAEKYNVQTVELVDSRAKKVVLGNGKATKEEIMKFYGETREHCADARLFTDWYLKSTN